MRRIHSLILVLAFSLATLVAARIGYSDPARPQDAGTQFPVQLPAPFPPTAPIPPIVHDTPGVREPGLDTPDVIRRQEAEKRELAQFAPLIAEGRRTFRFDTFADEQLWSDTLRLHDAIETVSPVAAFRLGLRVDVDVLPRQVLVELRANRVDLGNPAVTVALLRLDAVVGIRARVDNTGQVTRLGITCALCHSTVDDSFAPGMGRRLDGWANTALDVGALIALSPALDDTTRREYRTWGPGKYDPRRHAFDGRSLVPLNTSSLPVVIPPIYGLRGVGFETVTADGLISYWNSYVAVGQMGGQGVFVDRRIGLSILQRPDLVTPRLPALLQYQLSLRTPDPPEGSVDAAAAERGRRLFEGRAGCDRCHRGPLFTDVLRGPAALEPFLHNPHETGMDPRYAERSATGEYRTTPLRALWQHAPYFHDGSAPDLPAVVDHYDRVFALNLTPRQKADLVEYLKSL